MMQVCDISMLLAGSVKMTFAEEGRGRENFKKNTI